MQRFSLFMPFVFPVIWLTAGTLFGAMSGWYRMMARFPDSPADPILRLYAQSGRLGSVSMGGVLTLAVCRQGLRVSVWRILAPFSRPFLVPWSEIAIARGSVMLCPNATLRFGDPLVGSLVLWAPVADRLALAAGSLWPEPQTSARASVGGDVRNGRNFWVLLMSLTGAFCASVLMAVNAHQPLLVAALVFSATTCGLGVLVASFMKRE